MGIISQVEKFQFLVPVVLFMFLRVNCKLFNANSILAQSVLYISIKQFSTLSVPRWEDRQLLPGLYNHTGVRISSLVLVNKV